MIAVDEAACFLDCGGRSWYCGFLDPQRHHTYCATTVIHHVRPLDNVECLVRMLGYVIFAATVELEEHVVQGVAH